MDRYMVVDFADGVVGKERTNKATGEVRQWQGDMVTGISVDALESGATVRPVTWFFEKGLGRSIFRRGPGQYLVKVVQDGNRSKPIQAIFQGMPTWLGEDVQPDIPDEPPMMRRAR